MQPKESPLKDLDLSFAKTLAAELKRLKASEAPPKLLAEIIFPSESGPVHFQGNLSGKAFSWDGVPLDSLTADYRSEWGEANALTLDFPSVKAVYKGGPLDVKGKYDVTDQVLTLDSLDSKVDLLDLTATFTQKPAPSNVTFVSPPHIKMSGVLPVQAPDQANLKGSAQSTGDVVVSMGEKNLKISNLQTDFTLKDGVLGLPNLSCQTLGGQGNLIATLTPFAKALTFDGTVTVSNLSLQQITNFAGAGGNRKGLVSGAFQGKGQPDLAKLNGGGNLSITNSELLSVPIFRKLGDIVKVISVGTLDKGANANATYTLNEGILNSNDIKVASGLLTIDGSSEVDFNQSYVNSAKAVIKAGPGGLISQLSGQTIEVEGAGPFDDFKWKPTRVPGVPGVANLDTASDLLDALKSGGESGGNALEKLTDPDAAKKTLDTINSLKDSLPFGRKPKK